MYPTVERMQALADAFERLPTLDVSEETTASYAAFAAEVDQQFEALLGLVDVEWSTENPYGNSNDLFNDLDEFGRLRVFTGGAEHAYLTREQNNHFRAVHDYFAHYLGFGPHGPGRFQFGPKGEFRAWQAHARMFSPLARPALTSETLGQNAWVNFGPHSHLPPAERPYAVQKAALLPESLWYDLYMIQ